MKTLRFALIFMVIAFLSCSNVIFGQTVQLYPKATVTNGMVYCLEKPLSGFVIYHLTYHIDEKTGFVDRVHGNIHQAELFDSDGNKYSLHDTGNDNFGLSWSFWNETTAGGTNTFVYDQGSYQLPIGTLPTEGGSVWATFQVKSKGGEKYTIHSVTRFIVNSAGETEVIFNKENIDCNW